MPNEAQRAQLNNIEKQARRIIEWSQRAFEGYVPVLPQYLDAVEKHITEMADSTGVELP